MLKNSNIFSLKSVSRYCSSSANVQFISDVFNLSYIEARRYVDRNRFSKKEPELLRESISFCKQKGFSDDDILGNPSLMTVHPVEVQNHYLALEETGLKKISPKILAKARTYMKKEIKFFKEEDLIKKELNVAENFLSYLDKSPLSKEYVANLTDELRWTELHRIILQAYIKCRLGASDEDIVKLFRIHHMIKNKSFRQVRENIEIAEMLNFHHGRILKCGYLLHNYPPYPKKVIQDFDNLAGIDIKKAMRAFPKLVMVPPKNYIKIYGILKELGIPDDIIKNSPEIFQMSPETVRFRLDEIQRIPELKVLLNHPKVLSLVVHHNKATSRLSFLQQLQLKCAGVFLLSQAEGEPFDHHIRNGKDINQLRDLIVFLKHLLCEDEKVLKKRIKKHPFYLQVPLLDMEQSFLLLRSQKFDRASIAKVVCVLLYPKEKLEIALRDLYSQKEIKARSLTQVKKLNLLLYLMEKPHHFTGNGIWKNEKPKKPVEIAERTLE